jgi:hypothetical protein
MRSVCFKTLAIFIALLLICGCQKEQQKDHGVNTTPRQTKDVTDSDYNSDKIGAQKEETESIRVTKEDVLEYMADKYGDIDELEFEYNSEEKIYEISWTNPGGGMGAYWRIDASNGDVFFSPDGLIGNVFYKEMDTSTGRANEEY